MVEQQPTSNRMTFFFVGFTTGVMTVGIAMFGAALAISWGWF